MGFVIRGQGIEVAKGYIGVSESPPGSNRTIIGEKFGYNGVPWCAEFYSICELEAGNDGWDKSASCWQLIDRFRSGENGIWLGKPGISDVLIDDAVFFSTKSFPNGGAHVGRVEWVDANNGILHTIEGNSGDAVRREVRPYNGGQLPVYGIGRPGRLDGAIPEPVPVPVPPAPEGNPYGPLSVDGGFGPQTIKALQWALNQKIFWGGQPIGFLTEDGGFGPASKRALQWYLGVPQDGRIGTTTTRALQRHIGVSADGAWGAQTTRALQNSLNDGGF